MFAPFSPKAPPSTTHRCLVAKRRDHGIRGYPQGYGIRENALEAYSVAFVTSTPAAGRFLLQFVHREMKIEPSLLTVAQLDADPEIDSWERHGEAQSSFAKYCIGPRRG